MDHFSVEMDKLHMRESYQGKEHVHMANGSGMRILHVGQAILPTSSSRSLHLRNILHVPTLTKNLLSVYKFLMIIMFLLSFILTVFLLRIWTHRQSSLEVVGVVVYMLLMLLPSNKFSALLKLLPRSGTLV
jgi:hypothetical protein